jgi:hypothetical protein
MAVLAVLAFGAGAARAEPGPADCPAQLPAATRCYAGADENNAYYWIAIPAHWNGALIVHTHGGPNLEKPKPETPVSDLQRFAVMVQEGFAWAGSSYRHAGFGVRDAAADSDNLRKLFWVRFGKPKYTLLHGQSWGANVAEKTAELYGMADGKPVYDGVILTSGVLGGGTLSYDFRADLRAVYQYYCQNLPRAGEENYPLWQGLAADSRFKRRDVAERLEECTGISKPAGERTPQQQRALANILNVIHIPERTFASHMDWATLTFRDLVVRALKGDNPFSNMGVTYAGSDDDVALNKGVARFAATQSGVDALAYDADMTGALNVPTLTLHAEDDPTAFVELESSFRDLVTKAGRQGLLVQSFTREHEHSKEATPEYAALLRAMMAWIREGRKPTAASLAGLCETARARYGEACHFDADYYPRPLSTRVYGRIKPTVRAR